jgi:hypothetical protein
MFDGFFWVLDPPLLWRAITFSFLIHFWWILECQMCREEGFKFLLDNWNNGALPLDQACPEHLNVQSPTNLPTLYISMLVWHIGMHLISTLVSTLVTKTLLDWYDLRQLQLCTSTNTFGTWGNTNLVPAFNEYTSQTGTRLATQYQCWLQLFQNAAPLVEEESLIW